MDWNAVSYQLGDVPRTYKRSGLTYTWLNNSFVSGLHRYTNAVDGIMSMAVFSNATGKWLDVWGQLFGVGRLNSETDSAYNNRITQTLLLLKGTPLAIISFVQLTFGLTASVIENLFNADGTAMTEPSWNLKFGSAFPESQYNQLAQTLAFVRPAGVPFSPFYVLGGGLYLGTLNYLGRARVTGSYLGNPQAPFNFTIPATTNNALPLLPTLFLTDPTLNPGLPVTAAPTTVQATGTTSTQWGSDAYTNFTTLTGSPNGNLAGSLNDKAFDTSLSVLYVCTTAGTATTAVWTAVTGNVQTT